MMGGTGPLLLAVWPLSLAVGAEGGASRARTGGDRSVRGNSGEVVEKKGAPP